MRFYNQFQSVPFERFLLESLFSSLFSSAFLLSFRFAVTHACTISIVLSIFKEEKEISPCQNGCHTFPTSVFVTTVIPAVCIHSLSVCQAVGLTLIGVLGGIAYLLFSTVASLS